MARPHGHSLFTTPATSPDPETHLPSEPPIPIPRHFEGEQVPERHMKYYFEESMAVFKVENKLFKVHRHYLIRDSEFFQTLFKCPQPSEEGSEGSTDERAIPLPGVPSKEFEILLDYFYEGANFHQFLRDSSFKETIYWLSPSTPGEEPRDRVQVHCCLRVQVNHLLDLLSISSRYEFDRVRQYAIREIEDRCAQPSCECSPGPIMDPVEKIILAQKFDIDEWLFPAYEELCRRGKALEVSEAQKIGLSTSVLIAQARERARNGGYPIDEREASEAVQIAFAKDSPVPVHGFSWDVPSRE